MKGKSLTSKFFSLLLALSLCGVVNAQVDFKAEAKRIEGLIAQSQFEEADLVINELRASLEGNELLEVDSVQLFFSSNQSYTQYQLGNCESALSLSKQDTSLRKSIYGESNALTLASIRNLGVYYLNCDSTDAARNTLQQIVDTYKAESIQSDQVYAQTLDDLAFAESKLGNTDGAIILYEELLGLLGQNKSGFYYYVVENYSSMLVNEERYESSVQFYDDLNGYYSAPEDRVTFLRDYYNVFIHLKDYTRALTCASDLVSICAGDLNCQEMEINPGEFQLNGARLAMLLERYESAEKLYNQASKSNQDDPDIYIPLLLEKAQLYGYKGDKYKQLSTLTLAVGQHRVHNRTDSASYGSAVLGLGNIYTELGRFEQADKLFQEYIDDLEQSANPDQEQIAAAYQSLGNQRFLRQQFSDADTYLFKAKEILESNDLKETDTYGSVLNSLGALYESLANYEVAEFNYRRALHQSSEHSVGLRVALASNLANILQRTQPDNDSISILLNQAISWQEGQGTMQPGYANLLANRAFYLQRQGQMEAAKQDYEKANEIFKLTVQEEHPQYLAARTNKALLDQQLGQKDQALNDLLEVKKLYETYYLDTHPGYILALNNLANLYTGMESFSEAEALYLQLAEKQVKEINESFTYLSESEKKNFVKEKQKLLNNFKAYVVGRSVNSPGSISPQVIEKWYDLELSTKGILLNSTQKVRDQIFSSGDESLKQLFSEWSLARKQLADFQSLKADQSSMNQTMLDSLTQKINSLEKELSRQSTSFEGAFANVAPTFQELKNALGQGEALVEITRTQLEGEGVYTALVATNASSTPELIFIGKGDAFENKAFKAYKNGIAYQVEESRSYQNFWAIVNKYLKSNAITKIFYAPDGVYHKVSLSTLFDPEAKSYLLEEFEIYQVTSTKDLLDIKRSSMDADAMLSSTLLVGRPTYLLGGEQAQAMNATRSTRLGGEISDLPGTEEEIMGISSVLEGSETKILLKEDASEGNVKSNLDHGLVHIATHGFFIENEGGSGSYNDPMLYSGLLFAGVSNNTTDGEDGILTAFEIMNLGFTHTDMVVLSACETGLGEVTSGEGIYGLQRAFFVGGVNTVIMSLWKVDDSATRDLMTTFYKQYVKNGNKREAFVEAQKKIKKKYKSPIYWGAFVMLEG